MTLAPISVSVLLQWIGGRAVLTLGLCVPCAALAMVVSTLYAEILDVENCMCGRGPSEMVGLPGNGLCLGPLGRA